MKNGLPGESERKLRDREKEIDVCQETIRFLQRKRYAPHSEVVNSQQLSLFNEVEDIFEKEKAEADDGIFVQADSGDSRGDNNTDTGSG